MILQDLFKTCNVNDIIKSTELSHFDEDLTKYQLLSLYSFQVNKFCEIKAEEDREGCVLLGAWYTDWYTDLTEEGNEKHLDVAMYHRADIKKAMPVYKTICELPDDEEIPDDKIEQCTRELPRRRPSGYAFEFSEWSRVLGWEVDLGNVERCGEADFLAVVLNEMTFNGFLEESQEERREEMKTQVEEVDRIMQLPKEEREKHFVKAEDVFKILREELGEEHTPPTAEEKRLTRIRDARSIYRNAKEYSKEILTYLKGEES